MQERGFATSIIYIVLKHRLRSIALKRSFATSIIYIVLKLQIQYKACLHGFATSIIYIVLKHNNRVFQSINVLLPA